LESNFVNSSWRKIVELEIEHWLEILSLIIKIYNLSFYYSTKKASFEVMFGLKPNLMYEIPSFQYGSEISPEFTNNSDEKIAKK
jgi:hypothetical protein